VGEKTSYMSTTAKLKQELALDVSKDRLFITEKRK